MANVIRVEPGVNGVGQTLYFDDGGSIFDATNSYNAAPAGAPAAQPAAPSVPAPTVNPPVVDPMSGIPVPEPTPVTPEQQTKADSFLKDPVKAMGAPSAPAAPFELRPGMADEGNPEPAGTMPQVAVVPGSGGGFQPQAKSIQGVGEADRENISAGANVLAENTQDAVSAEAQGQQGLIDHYEGMALHNYLQAQAEDVAALAGIKRNQMVQDSVRTKIDDAVKFKPNRTELFEGTAGGFRAVLSAIGMIAGGMLQAVNGGSNTAMDAVFQMVHDNVADQVAQNTGIYQELVRRLGDEQAAADILRVQHLTAVADMTKAMELTTKAKEAKAGLSGARERAQLEANKIRLDAMAKLAPQEALHLAYRAPTPAQLIMVDQTDQALKMAGVSPKQYQDFTLEKTGNTNSQTVGQTIQFVKDLDEDAASLKSLSMEYGGSLPGTGNIDFGRSSLMRNIGARFGMKGYVDAADAWKIINRQLTNKAKTFGGVMTESDVARAEAETGVTAEQVLDSMRRTRQTANGQLMGVANGYFRGKSQFILDTLVNGIGTQPGMRRSGGRPR